LKSSIKDVSKRLNEIKDEFDPFYLIFHSGLRLVDYFSDRIVFHSLDLPEDEGLFTHLLKLNLAFNKMQKSYGDIAVITNGSIKTSGLAIAITHVWKDNKVIS